MMLLCLLFLPTTVKADRKNSRDSFPFVIALPIRIYTSPQHPVTRDFNARPQQPVPRNSRKIHAQQVSKDYSQDESEESTEEQRQPKVVTKQTHPFQGTFEEYEENTNFGDSESENKRTRNFQSANQMFRGNRNKMQMPRMLLGWENAGPKKIMVLRLNNDLSHQDTPHKTKPTRYETPNEAIMKHYDSSSGTGQRNHDTPTTVNYDTSGRVNYDTPTRINFEPPTEVEADSDENVRIKYDIPTAVEPGISANLRPHEELPIGMRPNFGEGMTLNDDQISEVEPNPEYETHYGEDVENYGGMRTISVPLMTTSDLVSSEHTFESYPDQESHSFSTDGRFHSVVNDNVKEVYIEPQKFESEGGVYGTDPVIHYVKSRKNTQQSDQPPVEFQIQHPTENPLFSGGSSGRWW